jgi:3-phenylpropionate/trans-cinnamate dioxygenase ferredoxin subunit
MSQNSQIQWHDVASVSEIDAVLPLPVGLDDEQLVLFKVEDKIFATINQCSHQQALLSDGYIDGDAIICPIHQAKFHIPTGKDRVLVGIADKSDSI